VCEQLFDILKFVYPDASTDYLIMISSTFVLLGMIIICLAVARFFTEAIIQKKLLYEAFPAILFGLFCIIPLGMHSTISFSNFLNYFQLLNPIL